MNCNGLREAIIDWTMVILIHQFLHGSIEWLIKLICVYDPVQNHQSYYKQALITNLIIRFITLYYIVYFPHLLIHSTWLKELSLKLYTNPSLISQSQPCLRLALELLSFQFSSRSLVSLFFLLFIVIASTPTQIGASYDDITEIIFWRFLAQLGIHFNIQSSKL